MRSDLSRSSAFVAALLALLPPRSAPLLVAGGGGQSSVGRSTALLPPLFPYPQALELLDVLDGASPARSAPERGDGTNPGGLAIPYPEGREILDRVQAAGDAALGLLQELRRAAFHVGNPATSPGERARNQALYRQLFVRFAKLPETSPFDDNLIDGSRDVLLARPPTGLHALRVELPDWRADTLDLPSAIPSTLEGQAALDMLDNALDVIEREQVGLAVKRQELVEGVPNGGLREVERLLVRMRRLAEHAVSRSLNSADRTLLQIRHASDLERLDQVALAARFQGVRLLAGGQVGLQGRLGSTLVFELPHVDNRSLGLSSSDVTNLTNSMAALGQLEEAIDFVRARRESVAETRAALENGLLLLR